MLCGRRGSTHRRAERGGGRESVAIGRIWRQWGISHVDRYT
jgi:hypothetical protein